MTIICPAKPVSIAVGTGKRKLVEDFHLEIDGIKYVIRKGFTWDGASIPRILWLTYGHPFDDIHEIAGLVHDAIYSAALFDEQGYIADFDRGDADNIYQALLRLNGCSWWQSFKEWCAVRLFGSSHWVSVLIWALLGLAIFATGCATKTRSIELAGMYANEAGTLAIGSVDVMAAPIGEESAFIKYDEDTAWLSPSTKLHDIKIMLTGTNSVDKADLIVEHICDAFKSTHTNAFIEVVK